MFFFSSFYVDSEKTEFFNIVKLFSNEIILISYNRYTESYEIIIDIPIFGYNIFIPTKIKLSYLFYTPLMRYFNRISIEEYIEEYKNIYSSDVCYPLNLFVYAKNKINNSKFELNKTTREVLETVLNVVDKSENRIWNQQFLQYFKHDYSEFYKYCLNRDSWTVEFKNFSHYMEEEELEAVEILNNMKKPYNKQIINSKEF